MADAALELIGLEKHYGAAGRAAVQDCAMADALTELINIFEALQPA